jgi:hypothetical protein
VGEITASAEVFATEVRWFAGRGYSKRFEDTRRGEEHERSWNERKKRMRQKGFGRGGRE